MIFNPKVKCLFFILIFSLLQTAWIDPFRDKVSSGNRSYQDGDFNSAMEHYDDSERFAPDEKRRAMLSFNRGAAEYRRGNYEKGIEHFNESLRSGDREVQKKAWYNMGNSYLQLKEYDKAFDSYAKAIKIDPAYEKAKKNIEYLLHNKEKEKGNSSGDGKDNKDESRSDPGKDKTPGDGEDMKGAPDIKSSDISREQMRNMLESLKNKPVRRQKGGTVEQRNHEKQW